VAQKGGISVGNAGFNQSSDTTRITYVRVGVESHFLGTEQLRNEPQALAAKRTTFFVKLTFDSPLRRCFYQHPLANVGERKVSGGYRDIQKFVQSDGRYL
jgi:hypothetical protein